MEHLKIMFLITHSQDDPHFKTIVINLLFITCRQHTYCNFESCNCKQTVIYQLSFSKVKLKNGALY